MQMSAIKRRWIVVAGTVAVAGIATAALAAGPIVYIDQGSQWTSSEREQYYSTDQGSRIMPLAWLRALRTADDKPFLWDSLARYGYLPRATAGAELPVGFMAAGPAGSQDAAINCSACHTRQIVVGGTSYRIDGGPALVDFQALLVDMDAAVGRVLGDEATFDAFAARVLGRAATPARRAALRESVQAWYAREHTLMSRALPAEPWGLGRTDALGMTYNRLTGLDLGPPPLRLIEENIMPADAPVRYPFLWNAPKQDRTQWSGFARNGSNLYGLARNLGQVYAVYGVYRPRRHNGRIDFLTDNSVQWRGLERIENLLRRLGPPKWPWGIDAPLALRGKEVFSRSTEQGGCAGCHGIKSGPYRVDLKPPAIRSTWATPLQDVGTDRRQYQILGRTAATGVLEGAKAPFQDPIGPTASAFELFGASVIGSIFQQVAGFSLYKDTTAGGAEDRGRPGPVQRELKALYAAPTKDAGEGTFKYESRVLEGIWAAAPYLHNGSVGTLADLLKPPAERRASFAVGPHYDLDEIGLAADQQGSPHRRVTTGCEDPASGNSRCGHDFGTALSPEDKRALLEYLKTL